MRVYVYSKMYVYIQQARLGGAGGDGSPPSPPRAGRGGRGVGPGLPPAAVPARGEGVSCGSVTGGLRLGVPARCPFFPPSFPLNECPLCNPANSEKFLRGNWNCPVTWLPPAHWPPLIGGSL